MNFGSFRASHELRQSTEASSYKPSLMMKPLSKSVIGESQYHEKPTKPPLNKSPFKNLKQQLIARLSQEEQEI